MAALRFVKGLLLAWCGAALVLLPLAVLAPESVLDSGLAQLRELAAHVWQFTYRNLRGSVLPFVVVLVVYLAQLRALRRELTGGCADEAPDVTRVLRGEQSLDLCASLFFGIGVIWTAIGMRDALLFALGDSGAMVSQSAFSVLARLVDGGILLALGTTIVGGVGGYLMRTTKSLLIGEQLAALYMAESQRFEQDKLAVLSRIERKLVDIQLTRGES